MKRHQSESRLYDRIGHDAYVARLEDKRFKLRSFDLPRTTARSLRRQIRASEFVIIEKRLAQAKASVHK